MGYSTTETFKSETIPGVSFVVRKMTEGRRIDLRAKLAEANKKLREIMAEQAIIEREPEESRNVSKWLDLQEEYEGLMLEKVNPVWITWGVKQIMGLEVDDRVLAVEDWKDWPSPLTDEVIKAVKAQSELTESERKNSASPTTSGKQEEQTPSSSSAPPANGKDITGIETAPGISQIV